MNPTTTRPTRIDYRRHRLIAAVAAATAVTFVAFTSTSHAAATHPRGRGRTEPSAIRRATRPPLPPQRRPIASSLRTPAPSSWPTPITA